MIDPGEGNSFSWFAVADWAPGTHENIRFALTVMDASGLTDQAVSDAVTLEWAEEFVIDTDGDGVNDGVDVCPDTPAGVSVDVRGCPDSGGAQQIVLAFGQAYDQEFTYNQRVRDFELRAGTTVPIMLSAAKQEEIRGLVADVFVRSDTEAEVVIGAPQGNAKNVYFAAGRNEPAGGRLFGVAFGANPHNFKPFGECIVYFNENDYENEMDDVIYTICHEIGHLMGLKHNSSDPWLNAFLEFFVGSARPPVDPLDLMWKNHPASNQVPPRTQCVFANAPGFNELYHSFSECCGQNSQFNLRLHVNGEDQAALEQEGLEGGTYDLCAATTLEGHFGFHTFLHDMQLFDFEVFARHDYHTVECLLRKQQLTVGDLQDLTFRVPLGANVSARAASEPGGEQDLYLAVRPPGDPEDFHYHAVPGNEQRLSLYRFPEGDGDAILVATGATFQVEADPVQDARIGGLRIGADGKVTWPSRFGHRYQLERAPHPEGVYVPDGATNVAQGGVTEMPFPIGAHGDRQFYRLRPVEVATAHAPFSDRYAVVPEGFFFMGDAFGEDIDSPSDEVRHKVFVSAFEASKYEATNQEVADAMNYALANNIADWSPATRITGLADNREWLVFDFAGSGLRFNSGQVQAHPGKDSHPCISLTWYGAAAYCNLKSMMDGLEPCYSIPGYVCDYTKNGWRMPTDAE